MWVCQWSLLIAEISLRYSVLIYKWCASVTQTCFTNYRWHTTRQSNEESMQHMLATGRAKIKDGTLILSAVAKTDNGAFYCTVSNSEGSETLEVNLSVSSALAASLQPNIQTVNLGQTADLVSKVTLIQRLHVWQKSNRGFVDLQHFRIPETTSFMV